MSLELALEDPRLKMQMVNLATKKLLMRVVLIIQLCRGVTEVF
jgi:hypothetical protein